MDLELLLQRAAMTLAVLGGMTQVMKGQTEILVPHIIVGTQVTAQQAVDFRTTFHVVNRSPDTVRIRIGLRDDEGTPLDGFLEGGPPGTRIVSEVTRTLSAHGLQDLSTAPGAPRVGWAQITALDFETDTPATVELSVAVTLETCVRGGPVTRSTTLHPSEPGLGFSAYAVITSGGGTGIALLNPSATDTAEATIQLVSVSGLLMDSVAMTLQPHHKIARFLDSPGLFEDVPSFRGTIEIRSTLPLAATAIQSGDAYWNAIGVFPARNLVPPAN